MLKGREITPKLKLQQCLSDDGHAKNKEMIVEIEREVFGRT